MNMRKHFDEELKALHKDLLKMAALGEQAIDKAMTLIKDYDPEVAKSVYYLEEDIDNMEDQIQSLCLRLIIEQQPIASDLRLISSALKMIHDLERIGDQARDIAEICKNINVSEDATDTILVIYEMASVTKKLIAKTIDAYVKQDLQAASEIRIDDDVVDEYFVRVRNDLIKVLEEKHPNAESIIDLIMITKYLERIADHAVNISKWVIYSIEG